MSYSIANWCYGLQSKSPWPDCVERLIGYGNTVGSHTSVTQAGHCCNSSIGIVAVFIILCIYDDSLYIQHVDVIKWKYFPRYWPCVWGIHRLPVNSPHTCQWRGVLMFSLICARMNGSRWRPKSRASRLFTQPFIQAQIKENTKAPRDCPLCGEFTSDRWIPNTNGP